MEVSGMRMAFLSSRLIPLYLYYLILCHQHHFVIWSLELSDLDPSLNSQFSSQRSSFLCFFSPLEYTSNTAFKHGLGEGKRLPELHLRTPKSIEWTSLESLPFKFVVLKGTSRVPESLEEIS